MNRTFDARRVLLLLAILSAACDSPDTPNDDAAMPAPDAGADAASVADAGSDATVEPNLVCGSTVEDVSSEWPPLPESCLPRCTAETAARVRACTTSACVSTALGEDPSPPVLVETVWGRLWVGCSNTRDAYGCPEWASMSCSASACPDEYSAWMACYVAQPSCTGERSALETCMQASPEYETCFDAAFDSCLPPAT